MSFKIKTDGDFDIDKLSLIYDTTFDELFWKIYNEEEDGQIVGYMMDDFDLGLYNPYEIYYDGKIVKARGHDEAKARKLHIGSKDCIIMKEIHKYPWRFQEKVVVLQP